MDPRFIAAKKASEAREKLLKQPPRPHTTTEGFARLKSELQQAIPNENSNLNIAKPSINEVKSNKGFSLKLDQAPHQVIKTERPPSASKSTGGRSSTNGSKLSMAQKLDSFINKPQ